ncbi:MAG: hypothetical protein M1834_004009 [Cirrosporium novae-zelandiae]|nr:MAG: hypothetical protein M1834_004009 [Cirrosporium novae-zelandiae]
MANISDAQAPQNPGNQGEWNEAQLVDALDRLQDMHIKMRSLRFTFQTLLRPLSQEYESPEGLFDEFVQGAIGAVGEIKNFTTFMRDDKNKAVLAKAKEARKDEFIIWKVNEHPDWLEPKQLHDDKEEESNNQKEEAIQAVEHTKDDLKRVYEEFAKEHPDLKLSFIDKTKAILLHLPKGMMHFRVEPQKDTSKLQRFRVTCKESAKRTGEVLNCIENRPFPNDLRYLLEMLVSYSDIMTRPCDLCGKLVSRKPQHPTGRRKVVRNIDGQDVASWETYHMGQCW